MPDDSIDATFATRMRHARTETGRTQGELADLMRSKGFDFHQQTIYKIERGDRKVTIGEAVALAAALGIPLDELVDPEHKSTDAEKRVRELETVLANVRATLLKAIGQPLDAVLDTDAEVNGGDIGTPVRLIEVEPVDATPAPPEPDYGNLAERADELKAKTDEHSEASER